MEEKSVEDICDYLEEKLFPESLLDAFREEELDGQAVAAGLGSSNGCDWLRDVVPKVGLRLKVHKSLEDLLHKVQNPPAITSSTPLDSSVASTSSASISGASSSGSSSSASCESQTIKKRDAKMKSTIKKEPLPNPFPIPTFRPTTTEKFTTDQLLTDGDRKYVVRTLATMLMTYTLKPSLNDCTIVAKSLIAEYPFLKDTEGDGEHSWKWFIYYRCQNVNRGAPKTSGEPAQKKSKLIDKSKHHYPPVHADDEVSHGRNIELLKEELQKAKPRVPVLKDLMRRTFANRWKSFLEDTPSLNDYLNDFPLLTKPAYASQEFAMVCQKESVREDFEIAFHKWARAIISYCRNTQVKSTAIQEEVKDVTVHMSDDCIATMALRCLSLLFAPIKTKKLGKDIPYIMKIVPRGTPPTQAPDKGNNQPHIILFEAEDDSDDPDLQQYFLSIEQKLVLESSSLISAIYYCVAVHYIFNLSYHPKSGDVWVFIQNKIFELESKGNAKMLPSRGSHFSGITRQYVGLSDDTDSENEDQ